MRAVFFFFPEFRSSIPTDLKRSIKKGQKKQRKTASTKTKADLRKWNFSDLRLKSWQRAICTVVMSTKDRYWTTNTWSYACFWSSSCGVGYPQPWLLKEANLSCLFYLWKINGPEHVKVIAAPYTDPDQPVRPDQNHHMATQNAPLHTEKTVTWLRRCAGWAQSSMSAHLPRILLSGSVDFKVTSLEIIYVTKSTYEIVKWAQYSHLALNIKLQWNNVREFCLKNKLYKYTN